MSFVEAWTALLGRHLRGGRAAARDGAPDIIAASPDSIGMTNPAGSYDDWTKRFIAFTDHAAVIARTSTWPAVVEVGHLLDQMCTDFNASRDEMGAWRPRSWPAWPDSAIGIDGTLKIFVLLEKLISILTSEVADSRSDPLEKAWNESIFALQDELGHLKDEYAASIRR